ncbi:hypothetical protein ACFL1D_03575 [Candidatus Omnitrophota bacterium]
MRALNKERFFNILPRLNLVLLCLMVLLVVYIFLDVLLPRRPLIFKAALAEDEPELINRQLVKNLPAFQEAAFRQRSLFGSLLEKQPQEPEAGFALLGIISSGEKKAAMIRDIRENKDYSCMGGENIAGFTVKEIGKDSVILESPEEKLELKL